MMIIHVYNKKMSRYKAGGIEYKGGENGPEKQPLTGTTYFRVKEWDKAERYEINDSISEVIDFDSQESITTKKLVVDDQDYWIAYSRPIWYDEHGKIFRLVDVLTVGKTEEEAENKLIQIKQSSEQYRTQMQHWVQETVIPELEHVHGVVVITGRGSIYDDLRIPSPEHGNNVNLILFTEYGSVSIDDLNLTIEDIKDYSLKHPDLRVGYTIHRFNTQIFKDKASYINVITPDKFRDEIEIDIISTRDLADVISHFGVDKFMHSLYPYSRRALTTGPILYDKTDGAFAQFQRELRNNEASKA